MGCRVELLEKTARDALTVDISSDELEILSGLDESSVFERDDDLAHAFLPETGRHFETG